ncbi:MAG: hypothetical protein AAFN08_16335, partial [Cyanobacteria bacterium J06559_3]
ESYEVSSVKTPPVKTHQLFTSPHDSLDLAGYCHPDPNYFHTRQRLNYLVDHYLCPTVLTERLTDLPRQFVEPRPRLWDRCDWNAIAADQIIGIEPDLFIRLIASSAEIEVPIRAYAELSRDHLQTIHPAMMRFVSGICDETGNLIEVGVWEKEERQHAPIFCRIYQRLVGKRLWPKANSITELSPEQAAANTLYRHAIRRITTEWSAVSMYLWLMAHSTGALQRAIAQPLQDEVNHLAKFWGMTRWGFADPPLPRLINMVTQFATMMSHHQGDRTDSDRILQIENLRYGAELAYIFARVLRQMCDWDAHLQPDLLAALFGRCPMLKAA